MRYFLPFIVALLLPLSAFAAVCEQNTMTTNDSAALGTVSGPFLDAVKFQSGSVCTISSVGVKVTTSGSPSDQMTFGLYSDSGGSPFASLATGTPVTVSGSWSTSTLSYTTVAGTTYWLVIGRSGATNNTNYYVVNYQNTGSIGNYDRWTTSWTSAGASIGRPFEVDGASTTPVTTVTPSGEVFASTTLAESPTSTYSIVDNPTQDFFMGMVLFLMSMFGILYLFKLGS